MDKNDLENKLKELRQGYLKKLEDVVLSLKSTLQNEEMDVDEIYAEVHKVSGTSGMYGLNEISNISTEFEFYLKELKNDKTLIKPKELSEKLAKYLKNIETSINGG